MAWKSKSQRVKIGEVFTAMKTKRSRPDDEFHYFPSEKGEPLITGDHYTIILADDHVMVRRGIRRIVEAVPTLKVVGEAGDGFEVLNLLKEYVPDLVILDISMPKCGGMEASREIKRLYPSLKILILTMHRDEQYLQHAMALGVNGYLLKEAACDELIEAIFTLKEGNSYFSPILSKYEPYAPKVRPTLAWGTA